MIFKKEWQKEINSLISGVKSGESQEKLLHKTKQLSKYLKKEGVDTIVIGCTDITKTVKTMKDFSFIDSSEALAEETIKRYLKDDELTADS